MNAGFISYFFVLFDQDNFGLDFVTKEPSREVIDSNSKLLHY